MLTVPHIHLVPPLAVLLALALAPVDVVANPLFIPASVGSMRETQFDRFRKGFSTVDRDRADQFDSNANLATYDRASTTGAATQAAEIGAGAGPFGAGAASTATQAKSLTDEYDRGAVTTANSRQLNQAGRRASTALDQGLVRGGARSEALIGGPVAGAGSSYQTLLQSRQQSAADADHLDQHLAEQDLVSEQYDRGVVRRDAAASAAMGEQISAPYGVAAVASEGQQMADFDESRQRGLKAAKRSLITDRSANLLNEGYHKQLEAKAGANDVVLVGPAGSSAGRVANARHLESSQGALQHADSVENRVVNRADTKALDNTWASGSQKQQVAIGNAALAGELSSGQAASRLANGYDRIAETGLANSAAKKTVSSTRKTFDDRELDQAYKSNALLGGCL